MSQPPPFPADAALFLDFDGTLVALAETPEAIVVPTSLVALLTELHAQLGGALAVVSGRQVDTLDRYLRPLRLPLAGERRDAVGHLVALRSPDLDAVLAAANELAAAHPGLLVERKQAAVALHYRQAPTLEALCRETMARAIAGRPQFEALHGKCVVEVKPAGINKGLAIGAFLNEAPFAGRTPVFAGDDTTDESGFVVVQRHGGIAIKVGTGPSQALHRLASPQAVFDWLATARDLLAQPGPSNQRSPA